MMKTSSIDLVVSSDHGQGHQRFAMKVILERKNRKEKSLSHVFTFSIIPCVKDTDELLVAKIYNPINGGLQKLCKVSHLLVSKEGSNSLHLSLIDQAAIDIHT